MASLPALSKEHDEVINRLPQLFGFTIELLGGRYDTCILEYKNPSVPACRIEGLARALRVRNMAAGMTQRQADKLAKLELPLIRR